MNAKRAKIAIQNLPFFEPRQDDQNSRAKINLMYLGNSTTYRLKNELRNSNNNLKNCRKILADKEEKIIKYESENSNLKNENSNLKIENSKVIQDNQILTNKIFQLEDQLRRRERIIEYLQDKNDLINKN